MSVSDDFMRTRLYRKRAAEFQWLADNASTAGDVRCPSVADFDRPRLSVVVNFGTAATWARHLARWAMIIGVLNRKGGVGKTTIAINVAATLAVAGVRVLLVDADPQASALSWSSLRERDPLFAVVGMARPTLHREVPGIAAKFDVVIIDGGPGVSDLGRAAILASDLVLIPVQPSPYDVWAAAETVQQIREARRFREGLKAAFIINRKIANTAIGRQAAMTLAQFDDLPVLATALNQRVIYAESAAQGLAVIEAAPHSEAALEMGNLVQQILVEKERGAP